MKQTIQFKTSMFDVSKERESPINPIYGISLLAWLKSELAGKVEISEPDAEDWGWYSELEFEGNNYLIGACAYFEEGGNPNEEIEWVFQVDKRRTFKERLFGKNKMSVSDSCFVFFKTLLEENPNFNEVQVA
ncbi:MULTISPECIES: hypothetical protein [Pseudomonas]|uniref:Uncharacterized protein n=1 Tax=Pseudomonas abyssi TaxID=170540 RepID=A0A395R5M2_9PSED|nr:hypothetical protein [Halopseudomonas gallaeciensis]RGP55139.1 hypothetical protein ASB58_08655 [Halopseudomonas gallaeciensis]